MNSSKMVGDIRHFSNQISFDNTFEIMSDNLQLQEFFARMFCPAGVSTSRGVSGHFALSDPQYWRRSLITEQEIKSTNNETSAD